MRQRLRPMLFDDEDRGGAEAGRVSAVASARKSATARAKAGTRRTAEGDPVHSFRTLLVDLATVTRNTVPQPCRGPIGSRSRPGPPRFNKRPSICWP